MATKKRDWTYYALMLITYATIIMFGVIENVKGVTFTQINEEFKASYDEQGYLVSFTWYGYVIFCLVCAFIMTRFGLKTAILCGYILNLIGCFATAYAPNFITVIITLMILWMGFGIYEVGYQALASILFTENSAIYLNLMHFFYGFGAIMGPQVASWLTRWLDNSYRGVYLGLLSVVAILFVISIFIPFTSVEKQSSEENNGTVTISQMFKMPYIWWAAATLGFMEVIEFAASNWGTLYYRDVYNIDPDTDGAIFVSYYYTVFTLARLVSGFFIEKIGYYRYLFGALTIAVVIFIVGFLIGVNGRWIIPLTGFFIGPLFPTYMCVLIKVFGEQSGNMSSIVIFLSGAINGLVQMIIGYINEWIGYEWGYRASIIYTIIPIILLSISKKIGDKLTKIYNPQEKKEIEMETVVAVEKDKKDENTETVEKKDVEKDSEQTSTNIVEEPKIQGSEDKQEVPISVSNPVEGNSTDKQSNVEV